MKYKGIILAGGAGTRLSPITKVTSKQLLPIYNKPMIYYSLSILMLADIKEILLISTPEDIVNYYRLLGSGETLGLQIEYKIQEKPKGIADAFILGEEFLEYDDVCLVLGDNIFYGDDLILKLHFAKEQNTGGFIFIQRVHDPQNYGVPTIQDNKIIGITEKPILPATNFAIPGLYFCTNDVVQVAKSINPSSRGELEITNILNYYLQNSRLLHMELGRGIIWLDTGTFDALLEASNLVQAIEKRQGIKIACLEEIAKNRGFI